MLQQERHIMVSRWAVSVVGKLVLRFLLLLLLQGDWVSNVMHGQGSFTDTAGHCWAGQFYNGAGPGLTCQL
jgi:hypothetical protein